MSTTPPLGARAFDYPYTIHGYNVPTREEDSQDRTTEEVVTSSPSDVLIVHYRAYSLLPFDGTSPTHQPTTTTTTSASVISSRATTTTTTWTPPPEYCALWNNVLRDLSEEPISDTLFQIQNLWFSAKSRAAPEEDAHLTESGKKYVAVLAGDRINSEMLQEINAEIVSDLTSHCSERLQRLNAAYQEKRGESIYTRRDMNYEECQRIKEAVDAQVSAGLVPLISADLLKVRIDLEMCGCAQDRLEGFSDSQVNVQLFWQLLSSFTWATKQDCQRALELGPTVRVCKFATSRDVLERLWGHALGGCFSILEYPLFEEIRKDCCDAFIRAETEAELAQLFESVQKYIGVITSRKGKECLTLADRTRAGCTLADALCVNMAQKLKDAESLLRQTTGFDTALSYTFRKCQQAKTQALVDKNRGSILEINYLLICLHADATYYDSIQRTLQSFAEEK